MSVASALARGMLMQRDQLFPTAADAMLRNISRRTGQPLPELCQALVVTPVSSSGV